MSSNGLRISLVLKKQLKQRWRSKSKILNQWNSRQREEEEKEVVAESADADRIYI